MNTFLRLLAGGALALTATTSAQAEDPAHSREAHCFMVYGTALGTIGVAKAGPAYGAMGGYYFGRFSVRNQVHLSAISDQVPRVGEGKVKAELAQCKPEADKDIKALLG